jgi:hypothetical protein
MKPQFPEFVAEGEKAFANDEFEEAVAWYEAAMDCSLDKTEEAYASAAERYRWLRTLVPWRSVRDRWPSDKHVLAVMTCEGREEFQQRLYGSLLGAGLRWWRGPKILVSDGAPPQPAWPGWKVYSHDRVGQAQTFFRVLREAARVPNLESLTMLEDDVILAKGALDYIATTEIDYDLQFVSWFSDEQCLIPMARPLLSVISAGEFQFNQAITFPAETVRDLLGSEALQTWGEPHGADRVYARAWPLAKVAVHYPNLVQHVGGLDSAVGNNSHGERTSPTYDGKRI